MNFNQHKILNAILTFAAESGTCSYKGRPAQFADAIRVQPGLLEELTPYVQTILHQNGIAVWIGRSDGLVRFVRLGKYQHQSQICAFCHMPEHEPKMHLVRIGNLSVHKHCKGAFLKALHHV